MRFQTHRNALVVAICLALSITASGCQSVPEMESILAGTWDLAKEGELIEDKTVLVIDSMGMVVEVRTVLGNVTTTSRDPMGTTFLNGQNVSISYSVGFFTTRRFEGTFNEDFTVATGKLFTETDIFESIVTVDDGPATLTKTG